MGQGSGKIKEVVPDTGIFERGKKGMHQNRIVLVSHGNIARAMLETIELFMGTRQNVAAYGLQRDMTEEMLMSSLREELLADSGCITGKYLDAIVSQTTY